LPSSNKNESFLNEEIAFFLMIKVGGGFFGASEEHIALENQLCFPISLINYFKARGIEVNEKEILRRHLALPYISPDGGIETTLTPRAVEDLTEDRFTATLYHRIQYPDGVKFKVFSEPPEGKQELYALILDDLLKEEKVVFSLEDVNRLFNPSSPGEISSYQYIREGQNVLGGHFILRLNSERYPNCHADVDGNIYQLQKGDHILLIACLEIRENT